MNNFQKLLQLLEKPEKIFLAGHKEPDGDSLGAIQGLYFLFRAKNIPVESVVEGPVPDRLSFLLSPDVKKIYPGEKPPRIEAEKAIVCDSSNLERTGCISEHLKEKMIINIDHHPDNNYFGKYNWVDSEASSVCEMLARVLVGEIFLPHKSAEAFAAGILYDTGGLRHGNTTAKTLEIISRLQRLGADISKLQNQLFASFSYDAFSAYQKALSRMKMEAGGKLSWTVLSGGKGEDTGAETTQKLIDEIRSIDGVEVAVLFVDEGEKTKISLRSKGEFPVNEIASEWGGGGHLRAAGAKVEGKVEDIKNEIISRVVEKIEKWDH